MWLLIKIWINSSLLNTDPSQFERKLNLNRISNLKRISFLGLEFYWPFSHYFLQVIMLIWVSIFAELTIRSEVWITTWSIIVSSAKYCSGWNSRVAPCTFTSVVRWSEREVKGSLVILRGLISLARRLFLTFICRSTELLLFLNVVNLILIIRFALNGLNGRYFRYILFLGQQSFRWSCTAGWRMQSSTM